MSDCNALCVPNRMDSNLKNPFGSPVQFLHWHPVCVRCNILVMSEKLLTSWCCRSVSAVFKRTRGATNPFLLSLLCFDATFDDEKKVDEASFCCKKFLLHMVAISMRLHLVKMLLSSSTFTAKCILLFRTQRRVFCRWNYWKCTWKKK